MKINKILSDSPSDQRAWFPDTGLVTSQSGTVYRFPEHMSSAVVRLEFSSYLYVLSFLVSSCDVLYSICVFIYFALNLQFWNQFSLQILHFPYKNILHLIMINCGCYLYIFIGMDYIFDIKCQNDISNANWWIKPRINFIHLSVPMIHGFKYFSKLLHIK